MMIVLNCREMGDLQALSLSELFRALTDDAMFLRSIDAALKEDLSDVGDVTTRSIVDPATRAIGHLVARQPGIVSGLPLVPRIAHRIREQIEFEPSVADGDACAAGQVLGILTGSLAGMLTIERTMLNYLGHLSGIATLTGRYVASIEGTGAVICDTRKTTPGLRRLEKYAVRCGGGTSHRMGLYDAVLYKDNHLARTEEAFLADVLTRAIDTARSGRPLAFVEVEVDTLEQFKRLQELPDGYIDMILLDNMTPEMMVDAVRKRDECLPGVLLEASGGVTLDNVRAIAETGVDRIAVGALTHSAPSLDIGLDLKA